MAQWRVVAGEALPSARSVGRGGDGGRQAAPLPSARSVGRGGDNSDVRLWATAGGEAAVAGGAFGRAVGSASSPPPTSYARWDPMCCSSAAPSSPWRPSSILSMFFVFCV
uniref:Uncharacterized protein n=1 Tax=Oryza sativa subsp. japonica TaxID=39947 RepID=Q67UN8_ORYSJ|nr:hypothetical protein [Oryza sativa Japonica Group]